MNKLVSVSLGVVLPFLLATPATPDQGLVIASARAVEHPHAEDHVVVKLSPQSKASEVLAPGSAPIFSRWWKVPVPVGRAAVDWADELSSRPGIEVAEVDPIVQVEPTGAFAAQGAVTPQAINDPFFSLQWHLPRVQADQAWSTTSGSGVVVAVVDSGVTQEGNDLLCHTFISPFNAITDTEGPVAANDDHGHGTHVAGTVAQCTNNGIGVAGVAFAASLMPVKVLNSSGSGSMSDVAQGVDWARAHGADVINLSLGCDGCSSSLVDEAIDDAVAEGIVIVAASGNSNVNTVLYPASDPDVIAVGATDYTDQRAPYSNTGTALDLVAPGGDLSEDANGDGYGDGVLQETFEWQGVNKNFAYYFFQGTSMATPHVAGAAALLKSLAPQIDGATVKTILESTAMDLGPSGYDTSYGHGLIQIQDAIDWLTTPDTTPPAWSAGALLTKTGDTASSVSFAWPEAVDDRLVAGYRVYVDGALVETVGLSQTSMTVGGLEPATSYLIEVVAEDLAGNLSTALGAALATLDSVPPEWSEDAELKVKTFRETELTLAWSGATDNVGVTVYRLRLTETTGLLVEGDQATVMGLQPGRQYVFEVLAGDGSGNWSEVLTSTVRTARFFRDTHGHLFYNDILWMSGMDITRGCNPPDNDLFCPEDPVSRGQFAAFAVRALGLTENTHPGFGDVAPGSTFAEDIGRLATAGITRGCNPPDNDLFCPDDPVTRGQLSALFRRALS